MSYTKDQMLRDPAVSVVREYREGQRVPIPSQGAKDYNL